MLDSGDSVGIRLVLVILLLGLSGFFSSAETALTTVSKMRIRTLAEAGDKKAITLMKVIENPGKMLSMILVGNNIVNLSASSMMTTLTMELFGSKAVGVATGVLTLLILVFGEITPKTMATLNAERLSLAYAGIVYWLMRLLTPVIFLVNKLSTARDVMGPRIDMVMVDVNATYKELIELFRKERFTRIPVYENSTDNVIGIINVKDFLLYDNAQKFSLRDLLRQPLYTYEYKKTAELMVEMRKTSNNIIIVLDEYGATAGLITLEDMLEEIVGDIRDEYDEDEEDEVKEIAPNEYLVSGSAKLDDLNDRLDLELESEDYDSIGGLVIGLLEHLPEEGEAVDCGNIRLVVEHVEKNRIDKIRLFIQQESDREEKRRQPEWAVDHSTAGEA